MNNKYFTLLAHVGGIGAIQAVNDIPLDEVIKIATQLIVAIAAIIHLFKKSKPNKTIPIVLLALLSLHASATIPADTVVHLDMTIENKAAFLSSDDVTDSLTFELVLTNNAADTLVLQSSRAAININYNSLQDTNHLQFRYLNGTASSRLPSSQRMVVTGIDPASGLLTVITPGISFAAGLKLAPGDTVRLGLFALWKIGSTCEDAKSFLPSFNATVFPKPPGRFYLYIPPAAPVLLKMTSKNYFEGSCFSWSNCPD